MCVAYNLMASAQGIASIAAAHRMPSPSSNQLMHAPVYNGEEYTGYTYYFVLSLYMYLDVEGLILPLIPM